MASGSAPAQAYVIDLKEVTVFHDRFIALYLEDDHTSVGEVKAFKSGDEKYRATVIEKFLKEFVDDMEPLKINIAGVDYMVEVIDYNSENGDIYDDLTDGLYLLFSDGELFKKTDTELMHQLRRMNAAPKHQQWTVFG